MGSWFCDQGCGGDAPGPGNKLFQTLQLFVVSEGDYVAGYGHLRPPCHGPEIACTQRDPTEYEGRVLHLIQRAEQFPNRVVSKRVVLRSKFKLGLQCTLSGGIHLPMVNAHLVRKCSGLPAFHSCGHDRDMVDAAALDGCISTNRFVALSPEQLAASPDVRARVLRIDWWIYPHRFVALSPEQLAASPDVFDVG